METILLKELIILFGCSILMLLACHRVRIPPIAGLLLTGILVGPHGFSLVSTKHEIDILAELGVILLLFTVGAEFSLRDLYRIKTLILRGGSVQVALTFAAIFFLLKVVELPSGEAALVAIIVALSSTSVALKVLHDRDELDTKHGTLAFAVLLFQDLLTVPLMLIIPLLAPEAGKTASDFATTFIKGLSLLACTIFAARYLVPRLLTVTLRTKNRELFLLATLFICFSVAALTQLAGLSLALGALLAGFSIAESGYHHHALGNVLPFQQVFTTLFFVSIGMLLDLTFVVQHFPLLAVLTAIVIVVKVWLTAPAALMSGLPSSVGLRCGLVIAQVGELSFVLAHTGVREGVLSPELYQTFLAVSVITISLSPVLVARGPAFFTFPPDDGVSGYRMGDALSPVPLLVVGMGVGGQMVTRAAEMAAIPCRVIDLSPDRVRLEHATHPDIMLGDGAKEDVLIRAGVGSAEVLVVTVSNRMTTRRIVVLARSLNPQLYIIARTRLLSEVASLSMLGADQVVSEELEGAVTIASQVLAKEGLLSNERVTTIVEALHDEASHVKRSAAKPQASLAFLSQYLEESGVLALTITDQSPLVGRTLGSIRFREEFGTSLIALKRDGKQYTNPEGSKKLRRGDTLLLLKPVRKLEALRESVGNAPTPKSP